MTGPPGDEAAAARPADEPTFAFVLPEAGTCYAAAAELENEPCSFAVKPAGDGAAAPSGESYSAVAPADEPLPASEGGLQGEEEEDEEDLKCFERHTARSEGS